MAVIFCAHFVAIKCKVFTTASTREIQLCAWPATQLTCSPYFRQILHASPLRMRKNLIERGLLSSQSTSSIEKASNAAKSDGICFPKVCLLSHKLGQPQPIDHELTISPLNPCCRDGTLCFSKAIQNDAE